MTPKRNYSSYEWKDAVTVTTVDQMTEAELREALCTCLEALQMLRERVAFMNSVFACVQSGRDLPKDET